MSARANKRPSASVSGASAGGKVPALNPVDENATIILKSGETGSVVAKRGLLIKSSKYFEGCLQFNSTTMEVSFDPKIIPLPILKAIVEFLELGELKPTMESLEKLFIAADYLQMESAMKVLYEYLEDQFMKYDPKKVAKETLLVYLRICNIVDRYTKGKNIVYKKLRVIYEPTNEPRTLNLYITALLSMHFNRIMTDEAVLKLDRDCIYSILLCNTLNISEEDVLRTIKMWINHDFGARKKHFPMLLECIRFDPKWTVAFLMDEFLCGCTTGDECICLTSQELFTAFVVTREGLHLHPRMFQFNPNERFSGSYRLP